MTPSLYEYVLIKLDETRFRWRAVALGSGVSKRTIEKIASKEIKDPGISHIQKLADYFRSLEGEPASEGGRKTPKNVAGSLA